MACVALASLISTIKLELLQPFPRVPLHHHQPLIQSFFERICSLQALLEESSGRIIKFLEIKTRDFALKAEDGIEIQLNNFLLAKDKDEGEHREKASQELHQTLQKAAENAAELLDIIQSTRNNDSQNNNVELDGSLWHPPRLDNKMVGRFKDHETIKHQLIRKADGSNSYLKFVWIVGMPGVGKTTLAQSVYKDPSIKAYFEVQAWITMPHQKYNKREILCYILLSLMVTQPSEIIKRSSGELADQIRQVLLGKRFLIVLDNMWNSEAWFDITLIFPDEGRRSGLLLTTTHFDGEYYDSSRFYVHQMNLLNSNNSWDIFFNILSRKQQRLAPKFEDIRSHEIVEKCEGLPQLIVTVAKRLSECNDIQREAKRIEKELDSIGILDRRAVTFVYNQLPRHLKVCFLYLAVFPRRSEILVKMLIGLWVAEGFADSEYEAYSYLLDLIDRSVVLVSKLNSAGEIKSCRVHSTLHSFCARETQKEGIFCAVNTQQHLGLSLTEFANSCRWLSLSKHSFDYYVLFRTNSSRSIFFFCENSELFLPLTFSRVLAFAPSLFLQSRRNFLFLRYLHVKQWFEGLDDIVSINPNLQILIVSHKGGTSSSQKEIRLASKIWETAQEIRHVEVSYSSLSVDPPPPSMVRESLETLYWLSLHHCRDEVFSRIPNVKKLGIICGSPSGVEECDNLHNLGYLVKLEKLMIAFQKGSPSGFLNLNSLPLDINIKKLKLKRTCLAWSDINIIGMLPNLQVLKLKEASNGSEWEMGCTQQGNFDQLKFLFLEATNLAHWKINGVKHFPCLERLVLKRCTILKAIPTHFVEFGPRLKSIELLYCSPCSLASAKEIKDGRKDFGFAKLSLIC